MMFSKKNFKSKFATFILALPLYYFFSDSIEQNENLFKKPNKKKVATHILVRMALTIFLLDANFAKKVITVCIAKGYHFFLFIIK
jgi:hypothetical protein